MTLLNEIYKCDVCGNTVEMVNPGMGQMICCGKPMILMVEKESAETGTEKHKPIVSFSETLNINIGSIPHPMEEGHFIKWIEVINEKGKLSRIFLKPGDEPKASFCEKEYTIARSYCNIHGLWITKK